MSSAALQPLLAWHDVTLRDGDALRFARTSWTIHAGEHWGIVGATESGKSLLARALAGRVAIWRGRFDHPEGRTELLSFESQRDLQRGLGTFHQARWNAFAGEGAPTVADLLSRQAVMGISPYQVLAADGNADYADRLPGVIALLEIEPLLDRKALHLSNGESRKLLLARALLRQPRLLILDDPYAGLDQASRQHWQELLSLLATQLTLVCVTGHPDELPEPITHILGVRDHRILFQSPRNRVTARQWRELLPDERPAALSSAHLPPAPKLDTFLLDLRHITVRYGSTTILHDLTWRVEPGERWALLGPNGSGKSTLLSLILGDNPQAYANQVHLFGRRRGSGESIWQIKARIGAVAPEMQTHYDARATCRQVVVSGFYSSIGLYYQPTPDQWKAADQWLERLALTPHATDPFPLLPAGVQRLVLLARALVNNPPLLVLDEPCQGLDDAQRDRLVPLIDTLCRLPGRALIYVTHHPEELPPGLTHLLRLHAGTPAYIGPFSADEQMPGT